MPHEQLPNEHDFDPYGGCLDCQRAWRNFGGLTIEQARAKFLENPSYYQEDFMFMGGRAFAYYFSVVEDYLRSVPPGPNDDDREAWILAHGIKNHFTGIDLPHVQHLNDRILALAEFVVGNLDRFGEKQDCDRVAEAWSELRDKVKSMIAIDRLND